MKFKEGNILIVDDDKNVLESLELFLDLEFRKVECISNPNLILEKIRQEDFQIVLLDMNFHAGRNTGNEGLYWLNQIKSIDKDIEVVMFTAFGDIELAVNCIKEGAFDFILKPWDNKKLITTLQAAFKLYKTKKQVIKLKNIEKQLSEDLSKPYQTIIGDSPKMEHVFNIIEKVSITDANVLILGENGTGKELVAREIHNKSERRKNPFIRVDLGSLSENVFESELFGHVKGAYTDAKENRVGRFETASGGTLFLDEIGNIPLNLQSKLLSAIETKTIIPVGSNKTVPVDIRFICATNANLNEKVVKNEFREDLLFRINTIQIKLPTLRERGSDIIKLADSFLEKTKTKYKKQDIEFSKEAIQFMKIYSWPGNVRELEHTIEKAIILCQGLLITKEDLGFNNPELLKKSSKKNRRSLGEIEAQSIIEALNYHNGNLSEVAKELKITRQTLYNKIRRYNINL